MRGPRTSFVLAGFAVLTVVVFRFSWFEIAHTAPEDEGLVADGLLYMWAISHVSTTLFSHPAALFDGGIFHPAARTLALSDHMIGQALVGLPVWWLSAGSPFDAISAGNPLLEFNLLSLASYVLGATAAYAYARSLTGSTAGALAAGIAFAFTPVRFQAPQHIQTLCTFFVPWTLLWWLRFVERRDRASFAAWVACWVAHSLMGMYLGIYFAIVMIVLVVTMLAIAPGRRDLRLVLGTLVAPVVVLILLSPSLWPYVALRGALGLERSGGLLTPLERLLPGPGTIGESLIEIGRPYRLGPGFVVLALAVTGFLAGRHRVLDARPTDLPLRALHVVGLGTTFVLMMIPVAWVQRVPGLDLLRSSHRALPLALLFVAYFVTAGVAAIERRVPAGRARRLAIVGVIALLIADMGEPLRGRRWLPVAADLPTAYRTLATVPEAVVYDQYPVPLDEALTMYFQIFHRKRLVGGYSGFTPPWGAWTRARTQRFPADESTSLLWDLGVRHVLWHLPTVGAAEFAAHHLPEATTRLEAQLGDTLAVALTSAPAGLPADEVRTVDRHAWRLETSAGSSNLDVIRDDDPRTAWTAEPPDAGPDPVITIDLGDAIPLAGVRLVPATPDDTTIHLTTVQTSVDGTAWTAPRTWFEPDSRSALLERPRDVRFWDARFVAMPVRWVRLENDRATRFRRPWRLGEIDLLVGP